MSLCWTGLPRKSPHNVCICTFAYTYMHTYEWIHVCMHVPTYAYTYIHIYIYKYLFVRTYPCIQVHTCTFERINPCIQARSHTNTVSQTCTYIMSQLLRTPWCGSPRTPHYCSACGARHLANSPHASTPLCSNHVHCCCQKRRLVSCPWLPPRTRITVGRNISGAHSCALHTCTAIHYNALQHAASHRSTLHLIATDCNALQHTATHYNILALRVMLLAAAANPHYGRAEYDRCTCSTLQYTAIHCIAAHCSTIQHTATHCNTLRHTATHCDTLQHTATHLPSVCCR